MTETLVSELELELELYREHLVKQLADVDTTLKVLTERPWLDSEQATPVKRIVEAPVRAPGAKIGAKRVSAQSKDDSAPPIKQALLALAASSGRPLTSIELCRSVVEAHNYQLPSVQSTLYTLLRDRQLHKGDDLKIRIVVNGKIQNLPELPQR